MLKEMARYIVYDLMKMTGDTRFASAVEFFIYDTVKILLMLAAIIFVVAFIRSFFSPEKTKKILSHKKEFIGNILASLLGVVTPFCSCSAVPLFIGFIEAGIPLGVTFSFLISSPMVNEVAIVLLWGLLGWKVTALYIGTGLTVAILGGFIIGRLKLEKWVEEYVYAIQTGNTCEIKALTFNDRLQYAHGYTRDILLKILPYVIIAIGIGGFIHGYVPQDALLRYAGKDNYFAVPMAVAIGVPLYASCGGILPVVHALVAKGMSMGTVLAFMMAVTGISLPEMIILRKVLKMKLLIIFVAIMAISIIAVGYMFNAIL